jgi:N-acetyl-anhydromuramyl-L-alanine amidase AmpD
LLSYIDACDDAPMSLRQVTVLAAAGALLVAWSPPAHAVAPAAGARQAEFAAAAAEFGVPASVLLAVSYNESQWDFHGGAPSFSGGYGLTNLTDVTADILAAQHVPAGSSRATGQLAAPALHTAEAAAGLLHVGTSAVKSDEAQNIRGGAALLASYARQYDHGRLPDRVDGWYAAVARYSQGTEVKVAQLFAEDVYGTIRSGQSATTADGQSLTLPADRRVHPDPRDVAKLGLHDVTPPPGAQAPECPAILNCDFIPAAYAQYNPNDKSYYGDHDIADRPNSAPIRYITLHDTEETYDGTLWLFSDPQYLASANYVVRSADGHVTQMIPTKDIAWDSGNESFYQHSVGIEQEGYAILGATWYTEAMYHSTARLVAYLAHRFGVPLDRAHILGHDNVPGGSNGSIARQHWDPGPFWDWDHFMALAGAPIHPTAGPDSTVVTIDPSFEDNKVVVSGCMPVQSNTPFPGPYHFKEWANAADTDCPAGNYVTQPAQSASFVHLHIGPSDSAPLLADPYLHPDGSAGTIAANDWGDKASAGQQYVVAGRQGDWTAIWYAGQKAWFHSPAGRGRTAVPGRGLVIMPKAGKTSVPVYVSSYPESTAWPADFLAWWGGTPRTSYPTTKYTIPAGQAYVAGGSAFATDWYNAYNIDGSAFDDRVDFKGQTRVYEITYNHRMAFVHAEDVDVVSAN